MQGICFMENNINLIRNWGNGSYGLHIIYSARLMGRFLAECEPFKDRVDYLCDRDAGEIKTCKGIPVVDHKEMSRLIKDSGKRAIIVICTGPGQRGLQGIYGDLLQNDIDADVFDYFENEACFTDRDFVFNGRKIPLFEHIYNDGYCNTRMTERSVELALAKEYLALCDGMVTEIGSVTPYYFSDDIIHWIIDPTDGHYRVTERKSLFDCDIQGENIISISTVEHVGTTDYGMNERYTPVDAIQRITESAKSYYITAPLGYNRILDEWIKEQFDRKDLFVLERGCNNNWRMVERAEQLDGIEYTPYWANGLLILCDKWG